MDINDLDKKVPGSKLAGFGALFILLGQICFGILALLFVIALIAALV